MKKWLMSARPTSDDAILHQMLKLGLHVTNVEKLCVFAEN